MFDRVLCEFQKVKRFNLRNQKISFLNMNENTLTIDDRNSHNVATYSLNIYK